MSRNINVNPSHYKVAGRERQGEDIIQRDQKQLYAQQPGGGHHGEVPPWEATRHSFATAQPEPEQKRVKAPKKARKATTARKTARTKKATRAATRARKTTKARKPAAARTTTRKKRAAPRRRAAKRSATRRATMKRRR